jgi:spore coat polysaccharide biosynthesis protein SpsF (cytidylyltransferase family)
MDVCMTGRAVAVVQARMGSHRLPGKVLLPLAGMPALAFMLRRVGRARRIDQIIVATSSGEADDGIAELATDLSFQAHRGSEEDVLDRFHGAAVKLGLADDDVVVRLTGDCPFIDPEVIDDVVRVAIDHPSVMYVSNVSPPTFPDGLDTEAIRFGALRAAWSEATEAHDREHVTPFIRTRPARFPAMNVRCKLGDLSGLRLTLDEPDDYRLLAALATALGPDADLAGLVHHLAGQPELTSWNDRFTRNEGSIR